MITEVLPKIEAIVVAAQEVLLNYGGVCSYPDLEQGVSQRLGNSTSRADILNTLGFLRRLAPNVFARENDNKIDLKTVDLLSELSWQYNMAKELLETLNNRASIDVRELTTVLKEASRILSETLKMRERVKELADIEEFQTTMLTLLDQVDPDLRDKFLDKLEGLGQETAVAGTSGSAYTNAPDAYTPEPAVARTAVLPESVA